MRRKIVGAFRECRARDRETKKEKGGMSMRTGDDPFDEMMKVASVTECTGLMPALPETEQGDQSLAALYAIHAAKRKKKKHAKA